MALESPQFLVMKKDYDLKEDATSAFRICAKQLGENLTLEDAKLVSSCTQNILWKTHEVRRWGAMVVVNQPVFLGPFRMYPLRTAYCQINAEGGDCRLD